MFLMPSMVMPLNTLVSPGTVFISILFDQDNESRSGFLCLFHFPPKTFVFDGAILRQLRDILFPVDNYLRTIPIHVIAE